MMLGRQPPFNPWDYSPPPTFMDTSRSSMLFLVHAVEIKSSGDYEVVLKSAARLRLSRRFRKRLEDRLSTKRRRD